MFSGTQATNVEGQGVAASARAGGVAAWGERKVAREKERKNDVLTITGGVWSEPSPCPGYGLLTPSACRIGTYVRENVSLIRSGSQLGSLLNLRRLARHG